MAISSAVEVYTILQRHLDTLLIISIMYLKRQSEDSRLKISLIKAINLSEPLLIGQEKKEFSQAWEEPKLKDLGPLVRGSELGDAKVPVHNCQQLGRVEDLPWRPSAHPVDNSQMISTSEWNDLLPSK